MFIKQIKNHSKTEFWRYIVGSLIIIGFSLMGQGPMFLAWILMLGDKVGTKTQSELMQLYDSNITLVLIMLSFVFALIGIFVTVKRLHKQTVKVIVTARNKIDWSRFAFAFVLFGAFVVISTCTSYYSDPESYEWNFKLVPFVILVIFSLFLIPIQTGVEELVFRGYLMQGFAKLANNRLFALLMTSLIFGGLHIANPEVQELGYITMVYYIATGLFLGIITLMDDGIELAMGFHAANNLFTALLVTADWTALQTHSVLKDISEPSVGIEILVPVLVVFPILLFIFSKRYKWSNWDQKLLGAC